MSVEMSDLPDVPLPPLDEPMALEEPTIEFEPQVDQRARMPEPLPVRLVSIGDVRLPAPSGAERALDNFYAGLLQFERMLPLEELIYRADNYVLRFSVHEPPVFHESMRALIIEVPSLADAVQKLNAAELEYTRQKGLDAGTESIVLLDPAGNWVELVETRLIT
jgi:hypothetical protein